MIITKSLGQRFADEMQAEANATLKCLERIPPELFEWRPHEKSMTLGYLVLLVAEIPKWITHTLKIGEINFETFPHVNPKTTNELVNHFNENIKEAIDVLRNISDDEFSGLFYLKNGNVTLYSAPKDETVSSSINHWVHHRGQLTVYMRLNNIPVPSIYGPSADDKTF